MAARTLRFWDLLLYALAVGVSIRWFAPAAAAGPGSIILWVLAGLGFLAPLCIATAELTTRVPGEGGVYGWTRQALGPFAGYLCGWLYWTSNLPFFSALLVFIVNTLAVAAGPRAVVLLQQHPAVLTTCCLAISIGVAVVQLWGLGAGKWLSNLGSAVVCGLVVLLLLSGLAAALGPGGPATPFAHVAWSIPFTADGAALWATMVFAYGGPEALAFLRNDVKGGLPQILRVLAIAGVIATATYILGTLAMLSILKPEDATRLSGLPDTLMIGLTRLGLGAIASPVVALGGIALLGSYSAWFGAASRLPEAAGVDRYLPAAFARRDPKTGAPVVSIVVQAVAVVILVLLSQAGEGIKAAYDFLVAMSVLSYTLPFVFLFIVYLRLNGRPGPADLWTVPGGPAVGRLVGWGGLVVTLSAIACTLVTPDWASFFKLVIASAVLILVGVIAYVLGARRAARAVAATP